MSIVDRPKFDADNDDVFVWKFPSEQLTIGSQLIVNQSQEAILVKGGQALDLFGPGTHTLSTGNIPLLQKLINLPFGGKTPFTAEVWYVSKLAKRNIRWGTKSPISIIDAQFNYPVSVRAFGRWGFRISESRSFLTQLVGTRQLADSRQVEDYFIGEIIQRLSSVVAKLLVDQKISVFHVNSKLNEISEATSEAIGNEFTRFGLEVVNFNVENINIPDDEKQKFQDVLGQRMEIEQVSGANVGQAYVTKRTLDTLESAAKNEGGAAGNLLAGGLGLGLGLGAGVPAGERLSAALNSSTSKPEPSTSDDPLLRLQKLKQLLDAGLITQDEFDAKKKDILGTL